MASLLRRCDYSASQRQAHPLLEVSVGIIRVVLLAHFWVDAYVAWIPMGRVSTLGCSSSFRTVSSDVPDFAIHKKF